MLAEVVILPVSRCGAMRIGPAYEAELVRIKTERAPHRDAVPQSQPHIAAILLWGAFGILRQPRKDIEIRELILR
jgi:hypothetical protein